MKKLTLGLAILFSGFAVNSFASLPANSARCKVSEPSYCGGLTVGLTGLYWRPSTSHLDYALTYDPFVEDTSIFNGGDYHSFSSNYDWGYRIELGYVFPCTGKDINLSYTDYDHKHANHLRDLGITFPTLVGSPLFANLLGIITLDDAFSSLTVESPPLFGVEASFKNHTWDLEFGQQINVGSSFHARYFAGLRYSKLEHTLGTTIEGTLSPVFSSSLDTIDEDFDPSSPHITQTEGSINQNDNVEAAFILGPTFLDLSRQKSTFDGIGPRFGLDVDYHLSSGVGLVGSLSTSLLVGRINSSFWEGLILENARGFRGSLRSRSAIINN